MGGFFRHRGLRFVPFVCCLVSVAVPHYFNPVSADPFFNRLDSPNLAWSTKNSSFLRESNTYAISKGMLNNGYLSGIIQIFGFKRDEKTQHGCQFTGRSSIEWQILNHPNFPAFAWRTKNLLWDELNVLKQKLVGKTKSRIDYYQNKSSMPL